jgi:hypothetical protein
LVSANSYLRVSASSAVPSVVGADPCLDIRGAANNLHNRYARIAAVVKEHGSAKLKPLFVALEEQ